MTRHTPLALLTRHVLTHKCHGVGAPVNVQEALGDVGAIIARLLKWGGDAERWYESRNVGGA